MYQTKFSTLWLAKFLLLTFAIFALSSCGFRPLYSNPGKNAGKSCDNFTVDKLEKFDLAGQKLQYKLQDSLNQACINSNVKYGVSVDLTKSKEAIAIQKDREITRYNLHYIGNFTVSDKSSGKEIYKGSTNMVGAFDAQTSDYGTYALEQDTESKLFEEIASDISLKISSNLLNKR